VELKYCIYKPLFDFHVLFVQVT